MARRSGVAAVTTLQSLRDLTARVSPAHRTDFVDRTWVVTAERPWDPPLTGAAPLCVLSGNADLANSMLNLTLFNAARGHEQGTKAGERLAKLGVQASAPLYIYPADFHQLTQFLPGPSACVLSSLSASSGGAHLHLAAPAHRRDRRPNRRGPRHRLHLRRGGAFVVPGGPPPSTPHNPLAPPPPRGSATALGISLHSAHPLPPSLRCAPRCLLSPPGLGCVFFVHFAHTPSLHHNLRVFSNFSSPTPYAPLSPPHRASRKSSTPSGTSAGSARRTRPTGRGRRTVRHGAVRAAHARSSVDARAFSARPDQGVAAHLDKSGADAALGTPQRVQIHCLAATGTTAILNNRSPVLSSPPLSSSHSSSELLQSPAELKASVSPRVDLSYQSTFFFSAPGRASVTLADPEVRAQLEDRLGRTAERLSERHPGEAIVLVSHGGPIEAVTRVLDRSVNAHRMPMCWYTGLSVFERARTAGGAGAEAPGPWCASR